MLKSRITKIKNRLLNSTAIPDIKTQPVSMLFGFDRGLPIDRYYIEKFLRDNTKYIQGDCLEIGGRDYTIKFGKNVKKSYILHMDEQQDELSIKGNLETGEGIVDNFVDCFIFTQTLPFIFDLKSTVRNVVRVLKPGGVACITVSGITPISRYDMDRWGHYWSFTDLSIKKLFLQEVPESNIKIKTFGNAKASAAFLYGHCAEEIKQSDLDYYDENYQLVITALVIKPS